MDGLIHNSSSSSGGGLSLRLPSEESLSRLTRVEVHNLYFTLLRQCSNSGSDCLHLAEHITSHGHAGNRYLGNLLVQSLARHGSLAEAQAAFNAIQDADVVSWTILIVAHAQNGHNARSFALLRWMQLEGVRPNTVTLLACSTSVSSLSQARQLYEMHQQQQQTVDRRVGNALVCLFGRLRNVQEAENIFDGMPERDVVTWTSLIGAYAQNGMAKRSIAVFQKMCLDGLVPDAVCFVTVLDACRDETQGRFYQLLAFGERGLGSNLELRNTLVAMYGRCQNVEAARDIFEGTLTKDVVSWNSILAVYAHNGHAWEALKLYKMMQLQGMRPNTITLVTATFASAAAGGADRDCICECIREQGLESNSIVRSSLIGLYGKQGMLEDALGLLRSHQLDVDTCTSMLAAYVNNEHFHEALGMFAVMALHGLRASKVTFLSLLDVCSDMGDLQRAKFMRDMALEAGIVEGQVEIGNAIVNMFGKCHDVSSAEDMFHKMQSRDQLTWTSMIDAYGYNELVGKAVSLFRKMQQEGVKCSIVTFVVVLDACCGLCLGRQIHSHVRESGLADNTMVANSLLSMYMRCGSLPDARRMVDAIPGKDLVTWNTLIFGYVQAGQDREAIRVLSCLDLEATVRPDRITFIGVLSACIGITALQQGQMIHERILASGLGSDSVLGILLISLYGKCSSLDRARQHFDALSSWNGETMLWNTMLGAYAQSGHVKELAAVFRRMLLEGVPPDRITFSSILFAFSHAGMQDEAVNALASMGVDHDVKAADEHYTCIIDLLGRKGRLEEAESLVHSMPYFPDMVTCMTLLSACKKHGDSTRANAIARLMLELDPEYAATYVLVSSDQSDI